MHGVHCGHDENVHDIVGVEIIVQAAGKPLFRDVHRSNGSAKHGNTVLKGKVCVN